MKKGVSIGIGIAVAIALVFVALWFANNGSTSDYEPKLPSTNITMPIGHSYSLNLTESVGMQANP